MSHTSEEKNNKSLGKIERKLKGSADRMLLPKESRDCSSEALARGEGEAGDSEAQY